MNDVGGSFVCVLRQFVLSNEFFDLFDSLHRHDCRDCSTDASDAIETLAVVNVLDGCFLGWDAGK